MGVVVRINEGSRHPISCTFEDRFGTDQTPSTVHYKVRCETTDQTLLDWTAITAASTVDIDIPSTLNAIQNDGNVVELKTITVVANKDLASARSFVYEYEVLNIGAI